MRIICSPYLSEIDSAVIHDVAESRKTADEALRLEWQKIISNPLNKSAAAFLSGLLGSGCISIRIALTRNAKALYHEKVGIFRTSAGELVTFIGSANETRPAWSASGNHESFEVFTSWWGERDRQRCERHEAEFEETWEGRVPGLYVHEISEATRKLIIDSFDGLTLSDAISALRADMHDDLPASSQLVLDSHQTDVLRSWEDNKNRGIIKHATGAGKTVTAIEAIRRWCTDSRCALVLVPSDLLSLQWTREITKQLCDVRPSILNCGGSSTDSAWRAILGDFTSPHVGAGMRVAVATLATASSHDFLERVSAGSHLCMIADEVHRVGARSYRAVMEVETGGRLGLSATPERFRDSEGTSAIFDYFGPVLKPEVSLQDAIRIGRLVPYDYYVDTVLLTAAEHSEWIRMTLEVQREYARLSEEQRSSSTSRAKLDLLLIRRAKIAKNAEAKPQRCKEVLAERYDSGSRWLVYCDNITQLERTLSLLRDDGYPAFEYHSAMKGDKKAVLDHLYGPGGIVVSIKCLDEGVDIPTVDGAVIMASSRNPREFIQRRGRVLRKAEEKYSATIVDILTLVPETEGPAIHDPSSLVKGELDRASVFAQGARNVDVRYVIDELAQRYGVTGAQEDAPYAAEDDDGEE